MKKLFILCSLVGLMGSCRKQDGQQERVGQPDPISVAKAYYDENLRSVTVFNPANLRTRTPKTPQWEKARVKKLSMGDAVVVPLQYAQKLYLKSSLSERLLEVSQLAQLLVYTDSSGTIHGEVITAFPDTTYLANGAGGFSGIIFVEDWAGNRLKEYKYDAAGIKIFDPGKMPAGKVGIDKVVGTVLTEVCYEIEGYNYSEADPSDISSWSEPAGCTYYETFDSSPTGGGAGGSDYGTVAGLGGGGSTRTLSIASGTSPIANIQQFIQCYTNSSAADHRYTVTVCVAQPDPGTRTAWNFSGGGSSATGNPVNVGHSFLIFNETYGGASIIRNIGFYPKGDVSPQYPTDQGQLNDDQYHSYNVSAAFVVSNDQFFQILNYSALGNNTGFAYDLNDNNCATFAIRAMGAGGVTLPSTIGKWLGGSGDDPGDLGQDLLSMSARAGTSVSTIQGTHPDTGFCN